MGSMISSPVSTIQWFIMESTRVLNTAATVVSITSEMVMNYITDLDGRAESQIGMVFRDIEDFLTELAGYGTQAQHCISLKKPELEKARDELIQRLVTCYKTHDNVFKRLKHERVVLHEEAVKLKRDAEINLSNCTRKSDVNPRSLSKNLSKLSRRVKALMKKAEMHSRREFSERRKNIMQIISCDRKAAEHAYKTIQEIIKDIKNCIFNENINRETLHQIE